MRISGNAGLKQKEGFFSSKLKRESAGDDLLLIGVENLNGQLYLHFYPIEVKIGHNQKLTLDKAIKQGTTTAKLLKETLNVNDYTAEIYKNFFAKLVLVNAQKMQMYNVWEEQNWMLVIEQYRKQIMSNDFKVGTHLEELIGEFGVISFKTKTSIRKIEMREQGTLIQLLEEDGYEYLIESIRELIDFYLSDTSTIKKDELLYSQYILKNGEIKTDISNHLETTNVQSKPIKYLNESQEESHSLIEAAEKAEDFSTKKKASKSIHEEEANLKNKISIKNEILLGVDSSNKKIIYYSKGKGDNPLPNYNIMVTGSSGKAPARWIPPLAGFPRSLDSSARWIPPLAGFSDCLFAKSAFKQTEF